MTYKRKILLMIGIIILLNILQAAGAIDNVRPTMLHVVLVVAFWGLGLSMLWTGYKECVMAWFPGEGAKGWQIKENEREYRKECMWIKGMGLSKHEKKAALQQAKMRKLRRAEEIMKQPENRRAEENWQKW